MDPVRIDLGVRIVATVPDYRRAGVLMDDVHGMLQALLVDGEEGRELNARFDFTHFQTRPCKALTMNRAAMEQFELGADGPEPSF
jgi:hypothetical protein